MATWSRYNFVVSRNDLPVKAAGQPVFLTPTGKVRKGQQILNVVDGEIVAFNPKENITLDAAGIATAEVVSVAVGVDTTGDGLANELRYLAGDNVNLIGGVLDASGRGPICAAPQIVDVAVDCLEPGETYSLSVFLDDAFVRSRYNFNESAEFVFSGVAPDLSNCDSCNTDTDCGDVLDQIVAQVNSNAQVDPTLLGERTYFQAQDLVEHYQPFTALRLYENDFNFDFTLADGACEECVDFTGITGITIDGSSTDFTFTTLPGDTTKSVEGHIDRIIQSINQAFVDEEVNGSAVRLDTTGKCCDVSIQINTSAAAVTLNSDGGAVAATSTGTPLADLGKTCAMRFVVDTVDVDCMCQYPTNKPVPNYWGRTIDVQALSPSWKNAELVVNQVQAQVLPTGLGYFWQDKEHYMQHHGGGGGDFRNSNYYTGKIALPDDGSRFTSAATADCKQSYCQYTLTTESRRRGDHGTYRYNHAQALTYFLVPSNDSTTRASFETLMNAIKDRSENIISDVSCTEA